MVVGSGIAGLSTAYELSGQGQKVVVLDRGKIGRGMTARTTAHLSANNDDTFKTMIDRRGEKLARDFYVSQAASITRIETIQSSESIDCDFRRVDGFLFPGPQTEQSEIEEEYKASQAAGMPVHYAKGVPLKGYESTRSLRYPNQATFHPTKYLQGLVRCIKQRGGRLFSDTAVMSVEEEDGSVVVKTEGGQTIRAKSAVVATNSPINDRVALHSKQAPYRTYAMALELPRGKLPDALYWDTLDPYHYVRQHPGKDFDYLIVGRRRPQERRSRRRGGSLRGDRSVDSQPPAGSRRRDPPLVGTSARHDRLLGLQRAQPGQQERVRAHRRFRPGHDPWRGRQPDHCPHDHAGRGSVAGTLWTGAQDRERAQHFISENVTAIKNLAEYVAPGEVGSFDEIEPGRGAIVRQGLKKVAAYRDEAGALHAFSAACTHLGCHLHWNSFERCWDCPCHGSQFSIDGAVLNGPAIHPLQEVEVDSNEERSKLSKAG